jgi:hypothetical protein
MLATYLKRQTTRATCYGSAAGPHLDEFTDWLAQSGFHNEVICQYLPGVIEFAGWVDTTYGNLKSCPFEALGGFRDYLGKHGRLRYSKGQYSVSFRGAQHFVEYLQSRNETVGAERPPQTTQPELVRLFEQWMQAHRGVLPATLRNYQSHEPLAKFPNPCGRVGSRGILML